MSYALIIAGIGAMVLSEKATSAILTRIDPDPTHHHAIFDVVVGTGVIPAWISLIHVGGLLSVGVGVIAVLAR